MGAHGCCLLCLAGVAQLPGRSGHGAWVFRSQAVLEGELGEELPPAPSPRPSLNLWALRLHTHLHTHSPPLLPCYVVTSAWVVCGLGSWRAD